MRSFDCPVCGSLIFFENSVCLTCNSSLGFDPATGGFAVPSENSPMCANLDVAGCNWLARGGGLCRCCSLIRVRPADDDAVGMIAFGKAQAAARRLIFQLDDLGLPVIGREQDPDNGLAFDLLSSQERPVVTGHQDGIVTLDLAEGDDGHREELRVRLAEPYRTLLGHFRHEVGHWYWTMLVQPDADALRRFRQLYGDDREDYAAALERHYAGDPEPGWEQRFVSIYASAHPWEDWAETFAHYLHIRDSLQTAAAFGIVVTGPEPAAPPDPSAPLVSIPLEDPPRRFEEIVDTWLPLTYALNQVNRSMGKADLYPFLLAPTVLEKLRFVHDLVTDATAATRPAAPSAAAARTTTFRVPA